MRTQVVDSAIAPGVLAYSDGEAVGWCAAGPRASYVRLEYSDVSAAAPDEDGLWALTCFVVRVGHRKQGIAAALRDGAVDLARRGRRAKVEAYPVDTAVKKVSSAELFHGTLSLFSSAGFTELARPLPHRAVVRRSL